MVRQDESDEIKGTYRNRYRFLEYLGRYETEGKIHLNKQLEKGPDPLLLYFLFDTKREAPIDLQDAVFFVAGDAQQHYHFSFYDRPDFPPPDKYAHAREVAFARLVSHHSLLDPVDMWDEGDLKDARINESSHPGIRWRVAGYKDKKDAKIPALHEAQGWFRRLKRGEWVQPSPVLAGGRGKATTRSKTRLKGTQAVGRLLSLVDLSDFLLSAVGSQRLTDAFAAEGGRGTALGTTYYHGQSKKFLHRYLDKVKYYCADAKKYDSSLKPWGIERIFQFLRLQVVGGDKPELDVLWRHYSRSLWEIDTVFGDGRCWRRRTGSCTGSVWNTLVQSFYTIWVVYTVVAFHCEDDLPRAWAELEVTALGDDHLTGMGPWLADRLTADVLSATALEAFDVTWENEKTSMQVSLWSRPPSEWGAQFLGKYFDGYVPVRPFSETFEHILFSEYGKYTPNDTYIRVLGNYLDGAGNKQTAEFLDAYLDWLEKNTDVERDTLEWPSWAHRIVMKQYVEWKPITVPAHRLTREDVLALMLLPPSELGTIG